MHESLRPRPVFIRLLTLLTSAVDHLCMCIHCIAQCVEKFCFHSFHSGSITTFAEGSGKHTMNIGGGVPHVTSCLPVHACNL